MAAPFGASAYYYAGVCLEHGAGNVSPDLDLALHYFLIAASHGHAGAQDRCAGFYMGDKFRDDKKAVTYLKAASNQKHAESQATLAACYMRGDLGLPKDESKAVGLFVKAANEGHAGAQNEMGTCYERGLGNLKVDLTAAADLYQAASNHGNAAAAYNFARCLRDGKGRVKDLVQAFASFEKAAD